MEKENLNYNQNESNNYIDRLIEKVSMQSDLELTMLVHKLIDERNKLISLVNIDALSGLNNRRVLNEINNITGLLLIDIDDFKIINDSYGHNAGDEVIKEVANIIKRNIRSTDYACRWGGDEFLVAFIKCPEDVIRQRAEKICNEVSLSSSISYTKASVSVGVVINDENSTTENLIEKADVALYKSKRNGKGQVSEFTNEDYMTGRKL